MLPLVKKGDIVEYKIRGKSFKSKCFQSNPSTVWVEDGSGRITKLPKRRYMVKVVSAPEEKENKPQKNIDDLLDKLRKKSS